LGLGQDANATASRGALSAARERMRQVCAPMSASAAVLGDVQTAIAAGAVKDRSGLVRRVTDLFLVNAAVLRDDEIAQFDEVLTLLVREIDAATRALLALRLASVRNAPTMLMRTLACDDEPDIACPVLTQSGRLDDPTLVAVARRNGQEQLFAISRRESLNEVVTDVLVERGDSQVLLNIAGNLRARLSVAGFERIVARAEGDDPLCERIGRRKDISTRLLAQLIKTASERVRATPKAEMPHDEPAINRAVQGATIHVARKHESEARDSDAIRASVGELHQDGQLDDEQIRSFAEDGQLEEVRVALSLVGGLPASFIDQALSQESGEMLLVIARAVGLSWATIKSILRLPIWRRPATANELGSCLARFERLDRSTAADIMRFYKARL